MTSYLENRETGKRYKVLEIIGMIFICVDPDLTGKVYIDYSVAPHNWRLL
jgi:hypothetical protein